MSAPKPLTLCDPPKIDWSRPSTPAASDYGDIYFSTDGGLEEARTVFLNACGLPGRWADRGYFAVGELGFGTGLNFLACWQLWRQNKAKTGRLHFISIEKYPFDKIQLSKALSAWPELAEFSNALIDQWPGRVKGFHHLEFDDVSLTLIHDDIQAGLHEISGKIDAWFLDGFSPSKNPEMWSHDVMRELARLSNPGARVGTFTVARAVRDALSDAGFEISKQKGFGRKRDRLEAVFPGQAPTKADSDVCPVIIGAGIAGVSLVQSFLKRGINPIIIDPSDGSGASGNPAAIIKPRLDIQDRPESRFFLSSYLYALRFYEKTGCVLHRGVQHLCGDVKQVSRFQKLLKNAPVPSCHMQSSASDYADYAVDFPRALVVEPPKLKATLLTGVKLFKERAHNIRQTSRNVEVLNAGGEIMASGSHIVWACGYGIRHLPQFSDISLRYSRGQVSSVSAIIDKPITYGNYTIPMGKDVLIGATHKRLDDRNPFEGRSDDDRENIEKFEGMFHQPVKLVSGKSRSSVRVTTPSTLPVIFGGGQEWGITGLGSRGFVFAPLLAEAIVANICEEVLPISQKIWTRFQAREKIQPENAPKKTPEASNEANGGLGDGTS